MACQGNPDEVCGDYYKMNIYKMGFDWKRRTASEANHIPSKDHTTDSGDGHYLELLPLPSDTSFTNVYQGCYIDGNLLEDVHYQDNENTIESCIKRCRNGNFLLSGLIDG